jgi:hypothetical protein
MGVRAPGVSQIKTLAQIRGSGVHSNERHVHQFQIASLELEKTRRTREREAALKRLAVLDARLVEIEAVIQKHQDALAASGPGRGGPAPEAPCPAPGAGEKRRTIRY